MMVQLAVRVDFLTGRYVASDAFNRGKYEWPAHPARFYSACTAALHEVDNVAQDERDALVWLATLGAPGIWAVDHLENNHEPDDTKENQPSTQTTQPAAFARVAVEHFVPVNDAGLFSNLANVRYGRILEAQDVIAGKATPAKIRSAYKKIAKNQDVDALIHHVEGVMAQKVELLPEFRNRQPRTFPSVTLEKPTQWFIWEGVDQDEVEMRRAGLERLFTRVTRLGHSSSFVCVSLQETAPEPNWQPDPDGDLYLRTVEPGQLDRLEREFALRAAQNSPPGTPHNRYNEIAPRNLPHALTAYRRSDLPTHRDQDEGSMIATPSIERGEWIAFEHYEGKRYHLTQTGPLCRAFRKALMAHAPDSRSPYLSGHESDGSPTDGPHIKVIAPPFVNHRHATGLIMGVALILPKPLDPSDLDNVYQAIGRWEATGQEGLPGLKPAAISLYSKGGVKSSYIRSATFGSKTMDETLWQGPSDTWVTATPIVLDRNPKYFGHRNDEKHELAVQRAISSIIDACTYQGLPTPHRVEVSQAPLLSASKATRAFAPIGTGGLPRFMLHARLTFDEPVLGPVILGAGRFFGLGLCLPRRNYDAI